VEEVLQQILAELREVKTNQAVLEREIKDNQQTTLTMRVEIAKIDRNQAVLEQGISRNSEKLDALQTDMATVKEKVEYTADVLEATLKMVDDLDQKYKAM